MRKSSLIFIFLLAGILNRVPAVAASGEAVSDKAAAKVTNSQPSSLADASLQNASQTVLLTASEPAKTPVRAPASTDPSTGPAIKSEKSKNRADNKAEDVAATETANSIRMGSRLGIENGDLDRSEAVIGVEVRSEGSSEDGAENASKAAIGDLPDAGVASETSSGLASESSGLASEAAVIEPVVFDAFAAEPFAGTSLMRMKRRLVAMAEVYAAAQTTADLSLAVAAAGSNDRFFRRNCEFLARLCRHQPFPALSSLLIFPEFLGVADELIARATRTMIGISIEELQKDPARRTQLLKKLSRANELALRIATTQRLVHANISALNHELLTIIARRHVNTPPADFLKTFGSDMCQIIDKYLSHWSAVLNQFEQHHTLFANHLNYLLNSGNQLSGVRHASQMSIMMRGFLDFKTSLEKYYSQVSGCPARLGELQKGMHEKLDTYASRQNRFKVRVSEFSGKFPSRDIDESAEPVFSSAAELSTIFALLEELTITVNPADASKKAAKTELKPDEEKPAKDLLQQLLLFVDGSIWEKTIIETQKAPAVESTPTDKTGSATDERKNLASGTQDVSEKTEQMLSEETEQTLPEDPEPAAPEKEN